MLLDVQAATTPARRCRSNDGARFTAALDGLDAKTVRIGWLGDLDGYLAMSRACSNVRPALERSKPPGARRGDALGLPPEEAWDAWLVWRRWLVASRIAPYLKNPENRDLIKPEALWEHDEARSLTGADVLNASQQRTEFYRRDAAAIRALRLPGVAQRAGVAVRGIAALASSIAGRAMDTYHRWMEVTIYATFAGLPAICVPAGFNADGPADGAAAHRTPAWRPGRAAVGGFVRGRGVGRDFG